MMGGRCSELSAFWVAGAPNSRNRLGGTYSELSDLSHILRQNGPYKQTSSEHLPPGLTCANEGLLASRWHVSRNYLLSRGVARTPNSPIYTYDLRTRHAHGTSFGTPATPATYRRYVR